MRRLVLGGDGVGRTVLGVLSTWGGDLTAVVDDGSRVETLREGAVSVDARVGDPADPSTYPDDVDTVFVAVGGERAREVVASARDRFPAALLVVHLPVGVEAATVDAVSDLADRVIDERATLADAVLGVTTGEAASRLQRLRRVLASATEPVAVVAHDNPDPDAIGSALALVALAERMGVEAVPCYGGEITHQENRALVNLLDIDLRQLAEGDLDSFGGVALVDHSRPGVNDSLARDTQVDVVVDHHPPREPVEARFVDVRAEAGATSTLLAEYFEAFGAEPDATVATALLFGIRVDTRDFTREAAERDFEAAAYLYPHVDASVLERVESPSMSPEVLDTLAAAIRNRDVRGEALATGVGRIGEKDALAQAADYLLGMAGVNVVIVYGFLDGTVHVSGRARGSSVDLGETVRDAFGAIGSAGGHADMAGAQIPLGILADVEETSSDSLASVVDEVVATRFFEALETAPSAPVRDGTADITFEFPVDES
ncbi:MAG: DHH family phosphoesterase [Haloferacaceae archaeon]